MKEAIERWRKLDDKLHECLTTAYRTDNPQQIKDCLETLRELEDKIHFTDAPFKDHVVDFIWECQEELREKMSRML